MDDILSQGGDRDPSEWPRRLALTCLAVLVAGAAIGYLAFGRHQHAHTAALPGPASAGAAPTEPDGIGGPALSWDGGLRLPVAGARPSWFSPATGGSEPISGLPANSSGYQFTRAGDGWAVQANAGGNVASGDHAVPPLPVWFLADGTRSVTRVGTANQVTAAAAPGAVWLTSYPPAADPGTSARTAREVSVAGVPLGPPVRLPAGYAVDAATDRGLLLAPVSQQPGTPAYALWNPADPRSSRTFHGVIAASPAEIAWTPPCAATCQVRLFDLETGGQTVVGLPAGSSAAGGAFSPDGRFLAIQVNSADEGSLAIRLEVASVASGRLTAVPDSFVSSDALVGFGWPAIGDSLVAEFIFTTKVQVVSWHPGAARVAVAAVNSAQGQTQLVVG
jgi:hypothetical protein